MFVSPRISPLTQPPARDAVAPRTPDDAAGRSAHLVGICGSGMKALAELLIGLGWNVTGSDLQRPGAGIQSLAAHGLRIHQGHDREFVPQSVDVLIYSPAVGPDNPERQIATQLGVPQMSYSQMLGHLMWTRTGISIAGTHGKSTTTAMTATILRHAGRAPSVICGAELCDCGLNGWAGESELFVVESCEYQRNFLALSPRHAAILGIEGDHFDCFSSLDDAVDAFREFARQVDPQGLIVVRGDCAQSLEAVRDAPAEHQTFSLEPGSDWWATDLRRTSSGIRFRVFHRGQYLSEIALGVPGTHNVLNALAAAAVAHRVGVAPSAIREGLREFAGIRRRFETVGSWRGVTLIDDYAHHPTAVRTTLAAARELFGCRRVWCAFQPHQISRTAALLEEFADSFGAADRVLVAPAFAAREAGGSAAAEISRDLAAKLALRHDGARFCGSLDQIISTLEDEARPGDIVITMGAGDIDRVHHEFTRRVQRHHPARRAAGPLYMDEAGGPRAVLGHTA